MTRYEKEFKRKLPAEFKEIEVCQGCGHQQPCPSDCPCGSSYIAVRVDGSKLTRADKVKLFPEKYN